jgi:membrane dipeptidase
LNRFYQEVEANEKKSSWVPLSGYQDSGSSWKISAILHLKSGMPGQRSGHAHLLYRWGLRSIGLTWNARNQFACGVAEGDAGGGLSKLGRMLEKNGPTGDGYGSGHMAKASFYDVLEYTINRYWQPMPNSFRLCPHRANWTRSIEKTGGNRGLIDYPSGDFVGMERQDEAAMLDHLVYIADLIGSTMWHWVRILMALKR